jgi:hypothetical protein
MGAADDIKQGLKKNLTTFTRQRVAEEKQVSAGRWRQSRMIEVRGVFLTEAADEVMEECYMKASDNDQLPAHARQIFYVARPLIEEQTGKPLSYAYFSQMLLPNYINQYGVDWDVVYDDRGHFLEPHTTRAIGLGTLNVRAYLNRVTHLEFEQADFAPALVKTCGPDGSFGAVLYVGKEGFLPLFKRVKLAERYDIAVMSSKGMSVTAARLLVDRFCTGIPLLVLHDFDSAGHIIKDTLEKDTRRFSYDNPPKVIDLGLHFEDIGDLTPEPYKSAISDERLRMAGVSNDAIDFLRDQRVELNAMTSRQLVDFVEAKLKQHNIGKVMPDRDALAKTYQMFVASDRLSEAFEVKEDFDESSVAVPDDLEVQVQAKLRERPDITWHRAVRLVVGPDEDGDSPDEDDDVLDEDDDP